MPNDSIYFRPIASVLHPKATATTAAARGGDVFDSVAFDFPLTEHPSSVVYHPTTVQSIPNNVCPRSPLSFCSPLRSLHPFLLGFGCRFYFTCPPPPPPPNRAIIRTNSLPSIEPTLFLPFPPRLFQSSCYVWLKLHGRLKIQPR